jgi:amino-acid N-acetyltransferase
MEHFFFAGPAERPLAIVGIELHGASALLRSLAVVPEARSAGLGAALVAHAEAHARAQRARAIYLLTTTAETFFAALGFARVARESAPPAIRRTREFAALCPSSSAFMAKELDDPA